MGFLKRRRRKGLGLTGIVVVVGALYFSGAGKWLWDRTLQLEPACYGMLSQIGSSMGQQGCAVVGSGIRATDQFFSNIGGSFDGVKQSISSLFSADSLSSVVGNIQVPRSLEGLGSNAEELQQRFRAGADYRPTGDAVKNAIDSFRIGRSLMDGDVNPVSNAVPWLQQGASTNGYGLLSQLSLGDIYRSGQGNVPANPQASIGYYSKAYQSINVLQSSSDPAAQQMLSTLPGSPEAIKQTLTQTIREMTSQMK